MSKYKVVYNLTDPESNARFFVSEMNNDEDPFYLQALKKVDLAKSGPFFNTSSKIPQIKTF